MAHAPNPSVPADPSSGRLYLGLLVALVTTLTLLSVDLSPDVGGDASNYRILAASLAEHGSYSDLHLPGAPAHRKYPPAYPVLLAALHAVGLGGVGPAAVLQALILGLGVLASGAWMMRRFGPGTGLAGAAALALMPGLYVEGHRLLSDVPFWTLLSATVWLADRPGDGQEGAARLAGALAGLSLMVRSAGLPLVVAFSGWAILKRRWSVLAVHLAVLVPTALAWRLHRAGEDTYGGALLLRNPYDPGQGTVGIGDLVTRVGENAVAYLGTHIPVLMVGRPGAWSALLALGLVAFALYGWARHVRSLRLPALLLPLYLGVVLLWPAVWAGPRFLFPAITLLVGFAVLGIGDLTLRVGVRRVWVATAALALLGLTSAGPLLAHVQRNVRCTAAVRAGEEAACLTGPWRAYHEIARRTATATPDSAVVVTRKPRLFYEWSGRTSVMYPLTADPAAFFETVRESGAGYVTVSPVSATETRYLIPVIQARPHAFCVLAQSAGGAAALLRIDDTHPRPDAAKPPPGQGLQLSVCPAR